MKVVLAMKLDSNFVCSWSQNGIYIPNWLLLAVVWQFQMLAMGDLCFTKLLVDFRRFGETRKSRKVLVCYYSKGLTLSLLLTSFVNHSAWLKERCQSIAQSYRCWQSIESSDSFPHLPSQNNIYVPSWLLLGTMSVSNVHFLI